MLPRCRLTALLAFLLLTAGCANSTDSSPGGDASIPPGFPAGPNTLDCAVGIERVGENRLVRPGDDYKMLDGSIALLTADTSSMVLQTTQPGDDGRQFAKTALLVREGAQAELAVPDEWQGKVSMTWGQFTDGTERIDIKPCAVEDPLGEWLFFAGGYLIDAPACADLMVRTEDSTSSVSVPIGASCPESEG